MCMDGHLSSVGTVWPLQVWVCRYVCIYVRCVPGGGFGKRFDTFVHSFRCRVILLVNIHTRSFPRLCSRYRLLTAGVCLPLHIFTPYIHPSIQQPCSPKPPSPPRSSAPSPQVHLTPIPPPTPVNPPIEILWDGRLNDLTSSADLEKWSWSSQVGPYQYYIHGPSAISSYVNLDASFANPADKASAQGAKISLDDTAKWNGQSMFRTELIPQTSAAINKGKVFYHFSISAPAENMPSAGAEHQLAFFESHFTELKYGGSSEKLGWYVGGQSKWEVELKAGEWHNVAYEVDFDAGSVGFWHSTGGDALTETVKPVKASTSSNGADWHVGVLRLPGGDAQDEDWYYSGVYIEDGELTTAVGGGKGGAAPVASKPAASAAPVASSSAAPAPTSTVVAAETPAVSSAPAQATETAAAPVETEVAAPTSTPAAEPAPSAPAGAELPEEFTIQQFIAWLKEETASN